MKICDGHLVNPAEIKSFRGYFPPEMLSKISSDGLKYVMMDPNKVDSWGFSMTFFVLCNLHFKSTDVEKFIKVVRGESGYDLKDLMP